MNRMNRTNRTIPALSVVPRATADPPAAPPTRLHWLSETLSCGLARSAAQAWAAAWVWARACIAEGTE